METISVEPLGLSSTTVDAERFHVCSGATVAQNKRCTLIPSLRYLIVYSRSENRSRMLLRKRILVEVIVRSFPGGTHNSANQVKNDGDKKEWKDSTQIMSLLHRYADLDLYKPCGRKVRIRL